MQDTTVPQNMVGEAVASKYIGMSRSFLRKARCEGKVGNRTPGPPFRRVGRKILYDLRELDDWLDAHRVDAVPLATSDSTAETNVRR